ncbi:hypothetical protein Hanom_Chr07g00606581 [Helianthus anomalus]
MGIKSFKCEPISPFFLVKLKWIESKYWFKKGTVQITLSYSRI